MAAADASSIRRTDCVRAEGLSSCLCAAAAAVAAACCHVQQRHRAADSASVAGDLFVKLPQRIRTQQKRVADRRLCLFILLARWRAEFPTWTAMARHLSLSRTKLIDLYGTTIELICSCEDYVCLSTKLDVPRIFRRVPEFAEAVWAAGGLCEEAVIGTVMMPTL